MIKEACCEGFTEGINAEALGANRIELCSNLAVGGLSPSFNEVKEALKFLNIPVFVMVRPREWNFIYTKKEKELQTINLEIIKRDLMEKHMVNMCFKKHIIVHFDMDEKELEKNILTFKSSLEIFKNEILNRS